MFVCMCNGVTERQVREAIEEGASSLADLTACLGVAAGCGCCADFTEDMLRRCGTQSATAYPKAA